MSGSRLREALRRPGPAFAAARALVKGAWYRRWCRLRGYRFSVGRNFRVYGRLILQGPGVVALGDDVVLYGRVTPWTYSRQARIQIGHNTSLDGVRFGCADSITIGRDCILAECQILDTDFHSTRADRRTNPEAPVRTVPVVIEDNVWISANVGLMPGAWIGRNSVVGWGSVCVRRFPANVVIFGNPARVVSPLAPIPQTSEPLPRSAERAEVGNQV
jgi:acetyltransferase-like isoleucine patch superfamily enzyme